MLAYGFFLVLKNNCSLCFQAPFDLQQLFQSGYKTKAKVDRSTERERERETVQKGKRAFEGNSVLRHSWTVASKAKVHNNCFSESVELDPVI